MKPIRILVNGAKGKMGSLACETLAEQGQFHVVGGLSRENSLAQAIQETKAQVVLDLTRADVVYQNSRVIIEQGAYPVIGTSGLLTKQIEELNLLCQQQQLGGIIVPNFSIGAVLMMLFAAQAAKHLACVEIIEAHHPQKLDAPSGTALKTAELIAAARKTHQEPLPLKELITGARGGQHEGVNIHSLRLPGTLAQQEVLFGNLGETLSIKHTSIDRNCFKSGIVLACEQVLSLNSLVYGLEHLLSL